MMTSKTVYDVNVFGVFNTARVVAQLWINIINSIQLRNERKMPSRGIGVPDVTLARTRRLVGGEEDSYIGCTTQHEKQKTFTRETSMSSQIIDKISENEPLTQVFYNSSNGNPKRKPL